MSYRATRKSDCTWIEYTQANTQTISNNTDIIWDVERSTSTPAMSINSTTGVISLDSSKRYWIQASIHVIRNGTGNIEFEFQTSTGGNLTESQGNFPMFYSNIDTNNYVVYGAYINSSFVVSLMVSYPTTDYKLVCKTVDSNSTLTGASHLFVMEME